MMPLEIGWAITVSWKAGDLMCRIMAFFRVFGLYLSSFILVCISMDRSVKFITAIPLLFFCTVYCIHKLVYRNITFVCYYTKLSRSFYFRYYAVIRPLQLWDVEKRGKIMLYIAWVGSTICSMPQVL